MGLIQAALIKKFEEVLEAKYIYVTHDGIYNVTRLHYVNNVAVMRYIGRQEPNYAEIITEFVESYIV